MDILDEAKKLGLNSYQAKVYLALLERESLSVSEIAKISKVPRARIYDTLDSLMIVGLATLKPGKQKKYSASNPIALHNKLNNEIEQQYNEQKETVARSILTFKKKFESSRKSIISDLNPLEYIEVLKNPIQIHSKYLELFSKTQKEVRGFVKPPFSYTSEEQWHEQNRENDAATKRGVVIRTIYQMPPEDQAEAFFARQMSKQSSTEGDDDRIYDDLPIKLVIFDENACIFTLEDPIKSRTSLTALVTEHEAFAKSFKFMFESVWEKSRDYFIVNNHRRYLSEYKNGDTNTTMKTDYDFVI